MAFSMLCLHMLPDEISRFREQPEKNMSLVSWSNCEDCDDCTPQNVASTCFNISICQFRIIQAQTGAVRHAMRNQREDALVL